MNSTGSAVVVDYNSLLISVITSEFHNRSGKLQKREEEEPDFLMMCK